MSDDKQTPRAEAVAVNGQVPAEGAEGAPTVKATERPTTGRAFGPPGGIPGDKSMNFGPSAKRLLRRLKPQQLQVFGVILLAIASVGLAVLGPKILGRATDIIFAGAIGKQLPAGITKEQAIEQARASGNGRLADLLGGIDLIPGVGIDFDALRNVLMLVLALYLGSFFLSWMQGYILNGVVQRTVFDLRSEVEDKLNRLPLSYFDGAPRGELLSRVTNDIDNMSTSLQQTLSQLLTSLLTVIGVVTMMFVVSPLLALIALVTIPISMVLTAAIAKRSQSRFVAQWRHTGALNGQIEEAFTGHELVKVFGRQKEIEASFAQKNEELYQASFGAQFISGLIMPSMMFIGNLNYVVIAVVGGLRAVHPAADPGRVDGEPAAVRRRLGRAGVRSTGCQGAGAGRRGTAEGDRRAGPGGVRARVVLLHRGQAADHRPEPGRRAGSDGRDRRSHRCGQDHAGQPDHAVLRAERRPDHPRRRGHHRTDPARPAVPDRDGAAGHLAVRRHDPRQHPVRQPGCNRGGHARVREGDVRGSLRAQPARRVRHGDRRGGQQRQRR
jgi:hypothetical protein